MDIDERTVDGQRVIGEIKTTVPYLSHDLGAQQRDAFNKDFAKLNREQADHKFFFVTDQRTFDVMKRRYVSLIPGVTIVLLTTGEAFDAADPADSALSN